MASERIRRISQYKRNKSKFQRESWEKMQGWESRVCTAKFNPEVRVKFSNWDVEAKKKMPQNCVLPRGEKTKWIISTGSFNMVSVHSLSLSWQMSVQKSFSLFFASTTSSRSSCISLSLSASSPLLSLLRGLADLGAYVFIKTAVRSSKWKGRKNSKRENFKVLRAGSQRIVHSELGEHSLQSTTEKPLTLPTC